MHAAERRMQIERANKMLFDDTDRVKALHGKLLLSEVLKQNEGLLAQKQQIKVLRQAQEMAFVEQQRQALKVRRR